MSSTPHDELVASARTRSLRTLHAGALVAEASVLPHSYLHYLGARTFQDWDANFESSYSAFRSELEQGHESRAADFIRQAQALQHSGRSSTAWLEDPGIKASIEYLRNLGVHDRWRMEQFFAQQGGPGARRALGYGDLDSTGARDCLYDDDQFQAVLNGDTPKANGSSLVGHHINSVQKALQEDGLAGIRAAMDGENIRIVTFERHLEYEHHGSFRTPSGGEADELTTRHAAIRHENQNVLTERGSAEAHEYQWDTALVAGLAFGSLGSALRLWQLRNDPRPWRKKAGLAAAAFARVGASGFVVSLAAQAAGEVTREFVAANADVIVRELGESASEMVLSELAGALASRGVGIVVMIGITVAARGWTASSWSSVLQDTAPLLGRVAAETIVFLLLGVALDALTPIPDPIIGPMVSVIRMTWSLGKLGWTLKVARDSAAAVRALRWDLLYARAAAEAAP